MAAKMNFQNIESLQNVEKVISEASEALQDKHRTIEVSSIPEVLAGALGMGVGAAGAFGLIFALGVPGLAAPGIASALAALGSIIGGGMAAGIFVAALPVAACAAAGVGVAAHINSKNLAQKKERLYKEALAKHEAIIQALKDEADAEKGRLDYLQSLNILLQQAIIDLKQDLDSKE